MAEDRVTTILAVELDAAKVAQELDDLSNKIANVKNEQKLLDAEYKAGKVSAADYAKSTAVMKNELSWLQKQQKGAIATTKLLTAQTDTYSDSLNGQRQKLADMQKAYDQMTQAQRESASGQAFLNAIKEQSDAVKELEEATGRAQRNVGNYPKIVQAIIPGFDKVQGLLGNMGVSLDALASNGMKAFSGLGTSIKAFGKLFITPPIIVVTAVLSAILFVVQKVSEAFKKNDDAMTALQKAFAVFKPIGEGVSKVFDLVAQGLAKVAEGAAKVVKWIAGKVAPGYAEAAEEAEKLVQAQDDLEESERRYTVNSARRSAEIAELRAKVADTERYTADQRKRFLQQAIALEKEDLAEAKANAEERLRLIEETAKRESDTSDETKNKIAQARAQMYQADEAYYTGVRRLVKQLSDFEAEERRKRMEEQALQAEGMRVLTEAEVTKASAEFARLKEAAQAALDELDESEDEDEIPTPEDMVRNHFGLDEEGVQYFLNLLSEGVDFATAKGNALADQWQRNAKGVLSAIKNVGGGFSSMAEMLGAYADESEEAAAAQKAFAFVGILTNQAASISEGALALAKGIESAAGVPFPANIPAIVSITAAIGSMLAGIATTITQSKQIFAQADAGKFANGGVVGGTSYTGDRMIAHVNSGEGIYTGTQANNLLQEIANNPLRSGSDIMTEALTAALANMPAPRMVYEEFKAFESDVATYDELAKI